ncbi:MAG: hypothetical protein HS113_20465 [Verrucomicrobiales bacterium]|nr:hypothetical protein [Verrucomicrobiales bacterium]
MHRPLHQPDAGGNWVQRVAAIPKDRLVSQQAGPIQPDDSSNIFQFALGDTQSVINRVDLDPNPSTTSLRLVLEAAPQVGPPTSPA